MHEGIPSPRISSLLTPLMGIRMGKPSQKQKDENDRLIACVHRFRATGDEDAFAEISQALNSYLLHLSSRKFYRIPGHSPDDIYQEGLIALGTKAVVDYDETKGPFLSFAKLCLFRHLVTILKSANSIHNKPLGSGTISLDAPSTDDDGDGSPVSSICPGSEGEVIDILERLEEHAKLKRALRRKLTKLERSVLDCYLKNMSYAEIVKHINRDRRGINSIDARTCDNALVRSRAKSTDLLEKIKVKEAHDLKVKEQAKRNKKT